MKLKITHREKTLLIITIICLSLAAVYYIVIKPQLEMVSALEKKAMEYSQMIDGIQTKASLDNQVYKDYKNINDKTQSLVRNYYPTIIQEKIILLFDEKIKRSNIRVLSFNFSEPALVGIELETEGDAAKASELEDLVMQLYNMKKPEEKKQENKESEEEASMVEKMTISITAEGTYNEIYSFLKDMEQENRSIICSDLNIDANNSNEINCEIKFDIYSIPKPFPQDDDYLKWDLTGQYGKTSPF